MATVRGEGTSQGGWKCIIARDVMRPDTFDVHLLRYTPSGTTVELAMEADGLREHVVGDGGYLTKPFMRLGPGHFGIVVAIAEAVKSLGALEMPDEARARLAGELEATKLHLADMRRLVMHPLDAWMGSPPMGPVAP